MGTDNTKQLANAADATLFLGEDWFDPLEAGVRGRIRGFIEEILEGELDEALSRRRYQRRLGKSADRAEEAVARGHRHGHRERQLTGTFGPLTVRVPRARLLQAAYETGRGVDCWSLSCRHQHAPRTESVDGLTWSFSSRLLAARHKHSIRTGLAGSGKPQDGSPRTARPAKTDPKSPRAYPPSAPRIGHRPTSVLVDCGELCYSGIRQAKFSVFPDTRLARAIVAVQQLVSLILVNVRSA